MGQDYSQATRLPELLGPTNQQYSHHLSQQPKEYRKWCQEYSSPLQLADDRLHPPEPLRRLPSRLPHKAL